jgi:hypothetical protein
MQERDKISGAAGVSNLQSAYYSGATASAASASASGDVGEGHHFRPGQYNVGSAEAAPVSATPLVEPAMQHAPKLIKDLTLLPASSGLKALFGKRLAAAANSASVHEKAEYIRARHPGVFKVACDKGVDVESFWDAYSLYLREHKHITDAKTASRAKHAKTSDLLKNYKDDLFAVGGIGLLVSIVTSSLVIRRIASTAMNTATGALVASATVYIATVVALIYAASLVEKQMSDNGIVLNAKQIDRASTATIFGSVLLAGLPAAAVVMAITKQPFGLSFGAMVAAACATTAVVVGLVGLYAGGIGSGAGSAIKAEYATTKLAAPLIENMIRNVQIREMDDIVAAIAA